MYLDSTNLAIRELISGAEAFKNSKLITLNIRKPSLFNMFILKSERLIFYPNEMCEG